MKKSVVCLCMALVLLVSSGCALQGNNKDLKESIDKLSEKIDKMMDDLDYGEEIHEIYDDTEVVKAYKSGDSSKIKDEKDKYILEQATKAVDKIIKDGMTDYEKEKAVYDYIFDNTKYDNAALAAIDTSGEDSHNPYGFFHDKSVICVGNATTFKLFMDMLDIDSKIIHSTTAGEHAWNVVKIGGDWYHVDLTFDNGDKSPTYAYFNVTDKAKGNDYPWDKSKYPKCTATKYCYVIQNAQQLDSLYDIPAALKKAIDAKKSCVYFKLDVPKGQNAVVYSEIVRNLFDCLECDDLYISGVSATCTDDNKSVVCTVSISKDEDSETSLINSIVDYKKLSEEFEKVFDGDVTLFEEYEEDDE